MNCTYTVTKNKTNRIVYRVAGIIFCSLAFIPIISFFKGAMGHPAFTVLLSAFLGGYGIYLLRMSFRKLAYNIKYAFNEEGITVYHHYGETHYDFSDVEFVTMIIADEAGIFYVPNLKAKKDIYTIPFTMKKELCEEIYEFINSKIKKADEESEIQWNYLIQSTIFQLLTMS